MPTQTKPLFFATPAAWRRWLASHHAHKDEVWVGFYKKSSGKPSITWPEAVDEALCFGWIDGIRKSIDETSYTNRFTPRRKGSNWSAINVKKITELKKHGLVEPAGLRAFQAPTPDKTGVYSFEQRRTVKLPAAYTKTFKTSEAAWQFYRGQAPYYQRTIAWWVISAKREETRLKRLSILIEHSAQGRRIEFMKRKSDPPPG